MTYPTAYSARRSMSQSVDPDNGSLLEEKPRIPRQRSHAPSPFISPRSLEQHAAHQKLQRLRDAPRQKRESAPSVEPPHSLVPEKLRKAEEHLREERDAAVLAELFGEYGSDAGGEDGAWDESQGRMAPPPGHLHKTRPHLDTPPVRESTADSEGAAEWPPVAGPSGLHSQRGVELGVTRGASDSEDDLDRSERGRSARSETYAPSERSNRISLFSAASSDEDSDASGAAFDEEDERDRRSGRGRAVRGSNALQPRPRKRLKKTAKEIQRQVEAQATDFLAGVDLPAPEYTPLSVKARLSNALAEQTKTLPLNARVDRVPVRERPQSRAITAQPDSASDANGSRTGPITERDDSPHVDGSATGHDDDDGASGSGPHADGAEELPDYQEDQPPEAVLAPKYEGVDLLEVQAYFRKPTRAGALSRWFAIVERDVEALPEAMLYTAYREDCDQLEKLGVALPSERFFPIRDFQSASSEKLLSTRPSFDVCAMLWTDLLDASHPERHKPVAGRGRACRCPLWTPERWRSWEDEVGVLRDRHGLATEDLVRILDTVFGQPDIHANTSGRSVLQLVYENNWIWYTHIVQLALLKTAYLELASDKMLDRLGSTLIAKREDAQIRLKALRAKADRHKGDSNYNELVLDYNFAELRSKNDQETRLELYERLCRIGAQGNRRRAIETWRRPIRPRVP